jgi:hypothetical protein
VPHVTQVAALARLKQLARVAPEHLSGRFQEHPRVRNEPCDRDPGVADAFLSVHEVLRDQWTIGPRKVVSVERVDLPECRPHLAGAHQQPSGKGRKRDEPLFQVHSLLAEGHEEIGPRVGIDDRLKRGLGLRHLQRWLGADLVVARRTQKVANDRDVGIEDFRR